MKPSPRIYGTAFASNIEANEVRLETNFEPVINLKEFIAANLDYRTTLGAVIVKHHNKKGETMWTRLGPTRMTVRIRHDEPMKLERIPVADIDSATSATGLVPKSEVRNVR